MPTTITGAVSKLAVTTRYKGPDSPEAAEARRDLAAIKIKTFVEKALATAPQMTEAQVDEIATALRGGTS